MAFARACSLNTVADLQFFIDHYSTAPQLEPATELRDQLAFQQATDTDTYQSYLAFMERYPQAVQYPQAEQRYHLLLFQSMTSGGRLQDYLTFLEENPRSPYRQRAEAQIFQLQTLSHQLRDYQKFIKSFPGSQEATQAQSIIDFYDEGSTPHSSTPLTAIYEQGHFGFMNTSGQLMIPAVYDSIPERYLCEPLLNNILPVYQSGHWKIVDLHQNTIWDQPYQQIEELGQGYIKIQVDDKLGVIHKGGWSVLPPIYQDIVLINQQLLAFKSQGLWGLASMTGREMLPAQFTNIVGESPFIALQKDRWAILNMSSLIEWYDRKSGAIPLAYDDWELISPGKLWYFLTIKKPYLMEICELKYPCLTIEFMN